MTVLAFTPALPAASGAVRLLWLLPVLPLLGWAFNTVGGYRVRAVAGWVATLVMAGAFAVAVAAVLALVAQPSAHRVEVLPGWEWIHSGAFRVAMDLRLDPLSAVLVLLITGVGTLIHLYSIGYMAHDDRRGSYFAWLNLFVSAMLVLVLAQNLVVLFLGWEGVGLCSFLLVGFWSERPGVAPAAKKAMIANRIGDVGFLIAIFLVFARLHTLDLTAIFTHVSALGSGTDTAVALLLFLGAVGKSAQIPLYVWLPDAMAGPTPVSALIHAATMVTAGVYLVARTHVLFAASPTAATVVVVIGALTALLAALLAVGQDDIKRVLAYSTVSQLGYMFIGVGLGPIGYVAGIFQLLTHGFFKANLFLGAGSVMHANDDDTDLRHFGGLGRAMPITALTMGAAYLAIIGFPFTSGFYSKDGILAAAFQHGGGVGLFGWVVGTLTVGVTAFYMSRLYFLTFLGPRRWPEGRRPHESPLIMTIPLVILALGALFGGLLNLSPTTGILARFLAPVFAGGGAHAIPVRSSVLSSAVLSGIAITIMAGGGLIAWFVYLSGRVPQRSMRDRVPALWRALSNKLYVDELYEFFTVTVGRVVAVMMAVEVEQRLIDGAVNGVATAIGVGGRWARRAQSGLVRSYALGILGGAVILIAFIAFGAL